MDILRAWLGRVFRIHPEDWKPLLLLQALIVAVCMVIASIKTVSNSLFVAHVGVAFLPYSYMISAIGLTITGLVLIPLVDKMPRIAIYRITTLGLAGLFVFSFFAMLAHQTWVYYLAYLLSNIADSILFLEFWLIAGDLCDSRQAKRIYPLVIGYSLIGGMMGTFGTKFLVGFVSTEMILLVSSGLLVGTLILVAMIKKAFPIEPASDVIPKKEPSIGKWARFKLDFRIVRESKLVQMICFSLVFYSILAFFTDFLFNTVSVRHFTVDGKIQVEQLTAFFALFDGISIAASLLFQFFLVNRILRSLGVTNAQLVLPSMFGVGFGSLFVASVAGGKNADFVPALGTRFGQKFLSSSLHRSSIQVIYSPISSEKRGRSKAFAEGVIAPLGVFMAGLLLLAVKNFPLSVVTGLAAVFSLLYLFMMLRLRAVYLRQIMKMFEDKNFGVLESFAGMFARLGEKEILEKLCDCLTDKDFNVRTFVVALLGEIKSKSAIDPLIELYHSESNTHVQATVIRVLGTLGTPKITAILREAMTSEDARVRANAVDAIVASRNTALTELLRNALADSAWRVSANAAIGLWRWKSQPDLPQAMEVLFSHYRSDSLPHKLAALYAFGEIATEPCMEALIEASRSQDKKIILRAIASLGATRSERAAKTLIEMLPFVNTSLQHSITAALIKLAPFCTELLLQSIAHPDIYARRHLINVAATMTDTRVANVLRDVALAEIDSVHRHKEWQARVLGIKQKDIRLLFDDTFMHLNAQAKENVLGVLRILSGNTPAMQRIIKDIFHPNRFVRGAALDGLEAIGHKAIAKAFVPILEERTPVSSKEASEPSQEDLIAWVRQWMKSPYRWIRACGAFTAGRLRLETTQQDLISALNDSYELVRANALEALDKISIGDNRVYIERMLNDPSPLARRYAKEFLR